VRNPQKGFTLVELMIVVAIVAILGAIIGPFFFGSRSDGFRVGELVKFSNKGLMCKTWEGTLKVSEAGTSRNGDSGMWDFTIQDGSTLIAQAQALAGRRVKITYHEQATRFNRCNGETRYDVVTIEEVK
jgi:prepilin-type N-terminal cleavage/methylation domain-containing protein